MHFIKTSFNGNPNIGLYAYATDEYCLIGEHIQKEKLHLIEKVLKVPIHQLSMCGTSLIGVFCAGNKNTLLVPELAFDNELKHLDHLGIKYKVLTTRHTALGNNIVANENGCLVSTEFSADNKKRIRQSLGVPLRPGKIASQPTVGSAAILSKRGCLVHRDITDAELKYAENILGVKCHPATVNMGNPHVKSGLIMNSNGFIIGSLSGSPEIMFIEEVLEFI